MVTALDMTSAIGRRVGRGRAGTISSRQLLLIAAVIGLVITALAVATVGRRPPAIRGTVFPSGSISCDASSCSPPPLFAGVPYHLELPDTWIGGSPDTYESNIEWNRENGIGRGWTVPAIYPVIGGPGPGFMAYDTDVPGMRLAINGPSTVAPDTDMEREIAAWESSYGATGIVDRVTLPAGEARRALQGPDMADGYLRITYLVVVGRDMYDLRFAYDPAVDRTAQIAELAATFRVP